LTRARAASHYRWLRLIVRQALTALEREGAYPRGKLPILFLMEEFASLGHMPIMEQAAAYFPGFGVKLWMVLQDLAQLKRHYRDSWETMLGNAGLVQFFATSDPVTNDYISARLGMTSFALKGRTIEEIEGEAAHKERLIYPQEIEKVFAARTGHQGLMVAGRVPVAALRLSHEEVSKLKRVCEAPAAS
jgi:type IV secretion system protein VirD4